MVINTFNANFIQQKIILIFLVPINWFESNQYHNHVIMHLATKTTIFIETKLFPYTNKTKTK